MPLLGFIQPHAAPGQAQHLLLGTPDAVILDLDIKRALLFLHMDGNLFPGPFGGVIQQITHQFHEILRIDSHRCIDGLHGKVERFFRVDRPHHLHEPRQRLKGIEILGRMTGAGQPGPAQFRLDQSPNGLGIAGDVLADVRIALQGRRLGQTEQHGERRLDSVGQIADGGPGSFQTPLHQRYQTFHLVGSGEISAFAITILHDQGGEFTAQQREGFERPPHKHPLNDQRQADGDSVEQQEQGAGIRDIVIQGGEILAHRDADRMPLQGEPLAQHQQWLVFRTVGMTLQHLARQGRAHPYLGHAHRG